MAVRVSFFHGPRAGPMNTALSIDRLPQVYAETRLGRRAVPGHPEAKKQVGYRY
jgi:hypothetical protein